MLRCKDNSIYTGMTNDLEKRMKEHFSKNKNAAKYTKSHDVLKFEIAWMTQEKTDACKLEYWIKRLKKIEKEDLILTANLKKYLNHVVSVELYHVIDQFNYKDLFSEIKTP